jgi:hypothetical protein
MKQFAAHIVITILRFEDWDQTLYSKSSFGDCAEYHSRHNARSLRDKNPPAVIGDPYKVQVQH